MRLIYTISIAVYFGLIHIASLFNKKAALWVKGRRNWKSKLNKNLQGAIWIHASSLGEFEQGRPIIEAIKKQNPDQKILLTFYSPSGYEVRKTYEFVDDVLYLPKDFSSNANVFLDILKPKIVIFVKYEYWFNFMSAIKKRDIPFFYVSAIFRSNQHFFKWYGSWFRKQLAQASAFFVQDKISLELLQSIHIQNVLLVGDTRFDRVFDVCKQAKKFPEISAFSQDFKLLVAGSTWPADEDLLLSFFKTISNNSLKLIIAPHQIDEAHLKSIEEKFANYQPIRFSEIQVKTVNDSCRLLIIDSIGKLMHLYQYASFAYIGGGFGAGIHNILEAATFGKPVVFGPKYHKFNEAKELIEMGGAFSILNAEDLLKVYSEKIVNEGTYSQISKVAADYVKSKIGASEMILSYLENKQSFNNSIL